MQRAYIRIYRKIQVVRVKLIEKKPFPIEKHLDQDGTDSSWRVHALVVKCRAIRTCFHYS